MSGRCGRVRDELVYNRDVKVTACSDLSAADWITGSDLPWQQLAGFGPSGFTAYARLRFLPDPAYDGQSENDVDFGDGASESAKLSAALQVLSRHTSTPDAYYFCLWDGWGSDGDSDGSPPLIDVESGRTGPSSSTSTLRLPMVYREDGSPQAASPPDLRHGRVLRRPRHPRRTASRRSSFRTAPTSCSRCQSWATATCRRADSGRTCPTPHSSGRPTMLGASPTTSIRIGPGSARMPRPSTASLPTRASTWFRPTHVSVSRATSRAPAPWAP